MEKMLVRLRAVDRRRGLVLRRYSTDGITFVAGAGWTCVEPALAARLGTVRSLHEDEHSPLAFEVCTQAEAQVADESEARAASGVRKATDDLPLVLGRSASAAATAASAAATGAVTTAELSTEGEERPRRGGRKDKE